MKPLYIEVPLANVMRYYAKDFQSRQPFTMTWFIDQVRGVVVFKLDFEPGILPIHQFDNEKGGDQHGDS